MWILQEPQSSEAHAAGRRALTLHSAENQNVVEGTGEDNEKGVGMSEQASGASRSYLAPCHSCGTWYNTAHCDAAGAALGGPSVP